MALTDEEKRKPTKNLKEFYDAQPPLAQDAGQGIGKIGRFVADNAQSEIPGMARKLYEAKAPTLWPALANKGAEFVAGVQSGFTGDRYKPQQFEAKSIADGVNALTGMFQSGAPAANAPAPSKPVATAPAKPATANKGGDKLEQTIATKPDDPSRKTPAMAESSSNAVLDSLGIADQKGYKQLTGGIYDTGNAEIYGRSNRADGKLNDFAGAGIAGRLNYEQRPENAQAVQQAQSRSLLSPSTSEALSRARAAAAERGDFEGALASIDQQLNAGKPADPRAALAKMIEEANSMPLNSTDDMRRHRAKVAQLQQAVAGLGGMERNDVTMRGQDITGGIGFDRNAIARQNLDLSANSPERGIASLQYDIYKDLFGADPAKAEAAKTKLAAMNAKGDKYIPLMGKDELGNPIFMGGFHEGTGDARLAGQATPPSQADIAATAKKYGISEAEVKSKLGIK